MLLYANGCSMTYGHELVSEEDDLTPEGSARRLSLAWPNRLGEKLNMEIVNDGEKGGSNDRILRTTTDFVIQWISEGKLPEELLVVIGWSNPVRTEFFVTDYTGEFGYYKAMLPELYKKEHFVKDKQLKKLWEFYVARMVDPVGDTRRTLGNILALQNLLKIHGIKYMFFDAAWKQWQAERKIFKYIKQQIDMNQYYGFYDKDATFSAYTSIHQLGIHPNFHPSAAAHASWANILGQFLYDQKILER